MYAYGEKVTSYDERVLNEREARAAAAIMFFLAFLAIANCFMLSKALFLKVYITFFMFDFFIRITKAKYSPSLLMGRFFVQNQDPEYVGAKQKRFSWALGFLVSIYMFNEIVINFDITVPLLALCFLCLTVLFLEAAFSICIGCFIYGWIDQHKVMYCPGGSCHMKIKDPVQRFNIIQKAIGIFSAIAVLGFLYYYTSEVATETYLGGVVKEYFMSEEDWRIQNELEYQQALEEFEEDDF